MRKLAGTQESAFNLVIRKTYLDDEEKNEGRLALVKIARGAANIRLTDKRIAVRGLLKAIKQSYLKSEGNNLFSFFIFYVFCKKHVNMFCVYVFCKKHVSMFCVLRCHGFG